MGRPTSLRLRDLRRVYRLIGECRDLGKDTRVWFTHFLKGAAELVGAPTVAGGHISGWLSGQPRGLMIVDLGWRDEAARALFNTWVQQEDLRSDPFYARICELTQKRMSPLMTKYRRQLIKDRQWYRTDHFHNWRKTVGVDDCLYSELSIGDGNLSQSITLHRALADRPFGEWEKRILHWLHHELAPLVGRQLLTAGDHSIRGLPSHLRHTLACLLEGDSEKQASVRLRLSRHTIHDYIKALYRHFGVNSRAELMALWVRPSSSNEDLET